MTDYLEKAARDGSDVLLEVVRRLERTLAPAGSSVQQEGQKEERGVPEYPDRWEAPEKLGSGPLVQEAENRREDAGPEQKRAVSRRTEGELPLLEAVRTMERTAERLRTAHRTEPEERPGAAAVSFLPGETEATASAPWSLNRTEGGRADLLQAEQVDRAFQRDSRRYDNGFFLF